jgi:hypothetical protein
MAKACVEVASGNSIEVNSPPLNKYPRVTPAKVYPPTMSPRELIPKASVAVAPGKSMAVQHGPLQERWV